MRSRVEEIDAAVDLALVGAVRRLCFSSSSHKKQRSQQRYTAAFHSSIDEYNKTPMIWRSSRSWSCRSARSILTFCEGLHDGETHSVQDLLALEDEAVDDFHLEKGRKRERENVRSSGRGRRKEEKESVAHQVVEGEAVEYPPEPVAENDLHGVGCIFGQNVVARFLEEEEEIGQSRLS